MKTIAFCLGLLLGVTSNLTAQQVTPPRIWSAKEVTEQLGDPYEGMAVYRVYEYADKGGVWNIVLCENHATTTARDTSNTALKAICLLNDHGGYLDKWNIKDAVAGRQTTGDLQPEHHIWFWTQYSSFTDLDGDGYVDPLIVYGTASEDNPVQRVKLILVYKGKKYAIRAVECILDDCRHLQYDAAFKALPASLRQKVEALLQRMRKEQDIILHEG